MSSWQNCWTKLSAYSKGPLKYWENQKIAEKITVLEIYGGFPRVSDFKTPSTCSASSNVGKIELESSVRLVGFVLPPEYDRKQHAGTGFYFDCNTFYVVFLDLS